MRHTHHTYAWALHQWNVVDCHIREREREKEELSFEFYFVEKVSEHKRELGDATEQPDSSRFAFAVILEMKIPPILKMHFEAWEKRKRNDVPPAAGRLLIKFFVWLLFLLASISRFIAWSRCSHCTAPFNQETEMRKKLFLKQNSMRETVLCCFQCNRFYIWQSLLFVSLCGTHRIRIFPFSISKERQIHGDIKRNMLNETISSLMGDAAIAIT